MEKKRVKDRKTLFERYKTLEREREREREFSRQ